MTSVQIPDGLYFLHADGSCWESRRFRGGRCVGGSDEATQSTHDAARDSWAGLHPSEDDTEVEREIAEAVIRAALGDDVHPEMVIVTRMNEDCE